MANPMDRRRGDWKSFAWFAALMGLAWCLAGCQSLPPALPTATVPAPPPPASATPTSDMGDLSRPPTDAPTMVRNTPAGAATATPAATATRPAPAPTLPAAPTIIAEWRIGALPAAARSPSGIVELDGRLYVVSRTDGGVAVLEKEQLTRLIPVCAAPAGIVADAVTHRVFVGCEDDKALRVIQDQKIVAVWKLEEPPQALAAAAGRVFVGSGSRGQIDVLDVTSGARRGSIGIKGVYSILGLAADAGARRLYVAAYEHQFVVDFELGETLETKTYSGYNTLVVDPARRRWYTNDYESGSYQQYLVALDQKTGDVVGRAPLGGDPRQAIAHPTTGRIYVANSYGNTVSVIEPERMAVIATIPVGRQPQSLCLDAAGGRLYVANYESHSISVLDVVSNRLVATLPLALIPTDMVADGARGALYALAPATNTIFVLRDGKTVQELAAGLEPLSLSLDAAGGRLYAVNYVGQSVSTIALDTGKAQETLLAGRPLAVALDAARGRLYAGGEILTLDGMKAVGKVTLQGMTMPGGPTPAPAQIEVDSVKDRLFIVASNNVPGSNGGMIIYAWDVAAGQQLATQMGGLTTAAMALDAAGRRLYSTGGRFGQFKLYVDDADTLRHVAERVYPVMPVGLAYQPATHHLFVALGDVYSANADATWELNIVDARTLGDVARWKLPAQPVHLTADPTSGRVYVAVGATGRILVIQDVALPAPPAPTSTSSPTPWPTYTPSATPPPATRTPTRGATLAPPTPTPCPGGLLRSFAPYWTPAVQAAAGCPARDEQAMDAAEQTFEKGRMLWRSDRSLIYVVAHSGAYWVRGDAWGQLVESFCGTPPAGKLHPRRGFGFLWCTTPEARDWLGWATEDERGYRVVVQETKNGLLWLTDRNQALLLLNDGTWMALTGAAR